MERQDKGLLFAGFGQETRRAAAVGRTGGAHMENSTPSRIGAALLFAFVTVACGDSQPRTPTTPTPDPAVGRYALTVTVGSTCAVLPDIVRVRTYTATIDSRGADNYMVTLSGAKFLADEQIGPASFRIHCSAADGLDCNQFTASREGDQLRFRLIPNYIRLNDEFSGNGGSIVEVIPPDDHQLGIEGTGLGRQNGNTIQASIDGRVWYCPATFSNSSEECSGCETANVAMTFTRR